MQSRRGRALHDAQSGLPLTPRSRTNLDCEDAIVSGNSPCYVRWLTAGRDLDEEDDILDSDRAAFALKVSNIATYAAFHIIGPTIGWLYFTYATNSAQWEQQLMLCHGGFALFLLASVHIVNRFRLMRQRASFFLCLFLLLVINSFGGPLLLQLRLCHDGWHWSNGIMVWMAGAPMAAFSLADRPELLGSGWMCATVLLMMSVMIWFARTQPGLPWDERERNTFPFLTLVVAILMSYGVFPTFVAVSFRWECREHRLRLQAQVRQHNKLVATRAAMRWLIASFIPPKKIQALPGIAPERWYTVEYDEYPHCTILQMDVSGFTALSSQISSAELVELIQSLFVSIDFAAECVQHVWKVELIGDCYKAIIGGPTPCADHARRGVALGWSIVTICRAIAKRLKVRLSVRVGVHTGSVLAAVVGTCMPRYLLFGPDCHVVGRLEAAATDDTVLLSRETAMSVAEEWPHSHEVPVVLADGSQCKGFTVAHSEISDDVAGNPPSALGEWFPELTAYLANLSTPVHQPSGRDTSFQSDLSFLPSPISPMRDRIRSISSTTVGLKFQAATSTAIARLRRLVEEGQIRAATRRLRTPKTALEHSVNVSPSRPEGGSSQPVTISSRPAAVSAELVDANDHPISGPMMELEEVEHMAEGESAHAVSPLTLKLSSTDPTSLGLSSIKDGGLSLPAWLQLPHHDKSTNTESSRQLLSSFHSEERGVLAEGGQGLLLEIVQHGAEMATTPRFQRTIVQAALVAVALTAALHVVILLSITLRGPGDDDDDDALQWENAVHDNAMFLPAILLVVALATLWALFGARTEWDWNSRIPQAVVSLVLVLATVALDGPAKTQHQIKWPALFWSYLAVMLQCSCTSLASRAWILWLIAYIALIIGFVAWVHSDSPGLDRVGDFRWWREILICFNFVVGTALTIAPMALSAIAVLDLQKKGRNLLMSTKRHAELEDKLLAALAPAELSRRFLQGEKLVHNGIKEGTAMFTYISEYEEIALRFGANECIAWVNDVLIQLDACVAEHSAVIKVETFNNFVLTYSAEERHVSICLTLALQMLDAVRDVTRPDGTRTKVCIGVSSGPFTTGIIGLQSPRYSIFGDTVNTASRMASTSTPCTAASPFVHISPSSYALLAGPEPGWLEVAGPRLALMQREGKTNVKGKGAMQTFCLSLSQDDPSSIFAM